MVVFHKEKGDHMAALPTVSPGNTDLSMAPWTTEHRAISVEQFFRNDDPVLSIQRLFR